MSEEAHKVKKEDNKKVLPRVASLKQPKKVNQNGTSVIPCGEKIPKNHKCFNASGSIEEAIGLIGRLKSFHFNLETTNARKMFIFARLTKIQEDLTNVIKSITTTPLNSSKHTASRFSMDKVKELEDSINSLSSTKYKGIPGSTLIESDIYMIWSVIRRCERQVISCKDPSIGIVVEESVILYMNKLGEYFSHLITHMANKF